jgi:hypothetical protein
MWIGILIAIVATILLFSWGQNRNTPLQSKESTDRNYAGDGGYYTSSDDDSSDSGDSDGGGDGGSSD